MNGIKKIWILVCIAGVFHCLSTNSCRQEAVSFDTLFPASIYKQMLCVYMNAWASLRDVQLPVAERIILEHVMYSHLMRMQERHDTLKDAYVFALLMRIWDEERERLTPAQ